MKFMFIQLKLTKTWSAPVLLIQTLHNKYTNSILGLKNMNSWSCKTDPHSSAIVPSKERCCLWFRLHLEGCEGISRCQYSKPYFGLVQLCFSKRWLLTLFYCTSLVVQPNIQSLQKNFGNDFSNPRRCQLERNVTLYAWYTGALDRKGLVWYHLTSTEKIGLKWWLLLTWCHCPPHRTLILGVALTVKALPSQERRYGSPPWMLTMNNWNSWLITGLDQMRIQLRDMLSDLPIVF